MTVFLETTHPGRFLLSEANGNLSREVGVIASGSGVINPGMVLAKVTATGKYVPAAATGSDGSQTAVAVAMYGCDATSADQSITIIAREAEVNGKELLFGSSVNDDAKKAAKAAQLAAQNIIVR